MVVRHLRGNGSHGPVDGRDDEESDRDAEGKRGTATVRVRILDVCRGPLVKEEREPLVDVLQEGNEVVVVTELPGVEKDDIKLESTDRALKIAVEAAKRRYFKEMELPHLVDPRTAKATYKNGVLEVRFTKSDEKRPTRAILVE